MKFQQAAKHKVMHGSHSGKSLDQIAMKDSGLLWIDRMQDSNHKILRKAARAYMSDPTIQKELQQILETSNE
jgi:hypothetical protein